MKRYPALLGGAAALERNFRYSSEVATMEPQPRPAILKKKKALLCLLLLLLRLIVIYDVRKLLLKCPFLFNIHAPCLAEEQKLRG